MIHLDVYQGAYSRSSWRDSKPTHWQRPRSSHTSGYEEFWYTTPYRTLCLLPGSCRYILRSWRWRWHVSPKLRLTSNGLHDVISQKTEMFHGGEACQRVAPQDNQDLNIIIASLRLKSGRGCHEGHETKADGLTGVNRYVIRINRTNASVNI
jgi:hypothetical protein